MPLEPFIGEICLYPYDFTPNGWLPCDGRALPVSQNTALFAIIGNSFGTPPARDQFLLPSLAGVAVMGAGSGPGLTPRVLGERVGADTVTLTTAQMPAHNHTLNRRGVQNQLTGKTAAPSANSDLGSVSQVIGGTTAAHAPSFIPMGTPDTQLADATVGRTGGGAGHENRQPYLVLNYCIATTGIFPSRP